MKSLLQTFFILFIICSFGSIQAQGNLFDDLIGLYSFNHDDDMIEQDLTNNGNNLTYAGDPPSGEEDRDWNYGNSVAFLGNTKVVGEPISFVETSDFTLNLWWMSFGAIEIGKHPVLSIDSEELDITVYASQNSEGQVYRLLLEDQNNNIIYEGYSPHISMDFWTMLSLINDNGELILYANTIEVLRTDAIIQDVTNPKIYVAGDQKGNILDGWTCFDDLFIYNRALAGNEIEDLGVVFADEVVLSSTYSQEEDARLAAYPNPSDGLFNITTERTYEVYSLDGKFVTKGKNNFVDLTDQSAGQYMLVFPEEGTRQTIIKR
jgi:hypothetical protein